MAWTSLTFAFGSLLTSTKMTQLQDNLTALANGDSGAPGITEAALDSSIVSQGKLKTTTSTDSVSVSGPASSPERYDTGTFAGGQYVLGFEAYSNNNLLTAMYAFAGWAEDSSANFPSSYTSMKGAVVIDTTFSGSSTVYFRHRYVQSSPPYDLGDGLIHDFVWALLDSNGNILKTQAAPDAPWHNNGPTNITAQRYSKDGRAYKKVPRELAEYLDGGPVYTPAMELVKKQTLNPEQLMGREYVEIEIGQKFKNMDMDIIPHPFGNLQPGEQVVLIDPVSELSHKLQLYREQEGDVSALLHDGYLRLDNVPLTRKGPMGVPIVNARWKNTRK